MRKSKKFYHSCFAGRQVSFTICILFVIFMAGCLGIKETARGVIGISTREIENSRKDALTKKFSYGYDSCYNKTLELLRYMSAYIYTQDEKKKLIAIYVSSRDTTSVGIFFKPIDAGHTQIEVSSASTYAKELIANGLFEDLEKLLEGKFYETRKEKTTSWPAPEG